MNPETENKIIELLNDLELLTDKMLYSYVKHGRGAEIVPMMAVFVCVSELEKCDVAHTSYKERANRIIHRGSWLVDLFKLANKSSETEVNQ